MNSVLIIDDDKELCALMKKCVEQENLSAVVAHGGLEQSDCQVDDHNYTKVDRIDSKL